MLKKELIKFLPQAIIILIIFKNYYGYINVSRTLLSRSLFLTFIIIGKGDKRGDIACVL